VRTQKIMVEKKTWSFKIGGRLKFRRKNNSAASVSWQAPAAQSAPGAIKRTISIGVAMFRAGPMGPANPKLWVAPWRNYTANFGFRK
jgi:hypothetical protein